MLKYIPNSRLAGRRGRFVLAEKPLGSSGSCSNQHCKALRYVVALPIRLQLTKYGAHTSLILTHFIYISLRVCCAY